MKFKTDENLPEEVAKLLEGAGYDASSVHKQSLEGTPDPNVATVCRQEQRILITLDLGFADIRAYPPDEHPGMLVLRLKQQDKGHVINTIGRLLTILRTEPLENRLWIVEEERIRIRA